MTDALKPRKHPLQARSAATVEALHQAVLQVLTADGLSGTTTTSIAERAGVSVGSLYQYYPNRDALLATVLEQHLEGIAAAVAHACRAHHGRPVDDMARALVSAFLAAKLRDPLESKALYAVASERGGPAVVERINTRMLAEIAAMLASAPDATFDAPHAVAAIALGAMIGPVRALLEGNLPDGLETRLEKELTRLVVAYLRSHGEAGRRTADGMQHIDM